MSPRRPSVPVVAAVGVATLAAVVTFARLGTPDALVFDEVHYVPDARGMLEVGVEPGFAVHPPLGKWVIAAGIAAVGDTPVGWRVGGALLAVITVAATVGLARRLTGRTWAGVVAGTLLTIDGAWLVPARTAMLDVTLGAFVVLGAYLLLVDRQRTAARDRASDGVDAWSVRARRRWPLLLAGAAFGAATATKWSGVLALAAAVLVTVAAERRRHRAPGPGRTDGAGELGGTDGAGRPGEAGGDGPWRATGRAVALAVVALAVVPAAVHLASYVPWLVAYPATATAARSDCPPSAGACDADLGDRLAGLVRYHRDVADFHLTLEADHDYRASPTTWPVLARPVVYFYEACDVDGRDRDGRDCVVARPGTSAEVVALGNPATWWAALVLLPGVATAVCRRDGAAGFVLVFLAAQFLPWLLVTRPAFSFYTVPMVPFLATAVAVAVVELGRPSRRGAAAVGVLGGGIVGALTLAAIGGARPAAATAALLGACLGGLVGGTVDASRERRLGIPAAPPHLATAVTVAVVGAATLLALYFAPIWYAWPLDVASLQDRWWFPGWV